jgi:hypothetical protein
MKKLIVICMIVVIATNITVAQTSKNYHCEVLLLKEPYSKKIVFEDRIMDNAINGKIIFDALSKIKTQKLLNVIDTVILLPQELSDSNDYETTGGYVDSSSRFSTMVIIKGKREEMMVAIWHEASHLLNNNFFPSDTAFLVKWRDVASSGKIPEVFEDNIKGKAISVYLVQTTSSILSLKETNDPYYGFCCPEAATCCDEDIAYFTGAVYQLLVFNKGPLLLVNKNNIDPRYPAKLLLLVEGGFISKEDYQSAKKILGW